MGDDCASLVVLADELLEIILSYSFLSHRDLCRFAQVCVHFRDVAYDTELWKKKAIYRWKHWTNQPDHHWKEIFQNRLKTEKETIKILDRFSEKYGSKADVCNDEYQTLTHLISDDTYDELFECTLEEIINYGDPKYSNLTHQYYADRVYAFFKKVLLKKIYAMLMQKPANEQNLEDGALIIAKWIDYRNMSTVSTAEVTSKLDNLAARVRCIVQYEAPPTQSSDTTDPQQCLQILEGIKQVIFGEENFTGNSQDYYNVNNSLITEVLRSKKGIPISLSIVFEAVARRLGVNLEPVNAPHHFLLRWHPNHDPSIQLSRSIYIDAFLEGKFYTQEECASRFVSGLASNLPREMLFPRASPKDVFTRMVTNIVNIYHDSNRQDNGLRSFRNALELLILVKPNDLEYKSLLAHVNLHLGINLDESMRILQEMLPIRNEDTIHNLLERAQEKKHQEAEEQSEPIQKTLRSDPENTDVKYRVGMVMRHRRYHYGCVIYGWDYVCDMDESWITQMGVDRLTLGRNQPFYNVLGDDGSSRYAAQENLIEEPDQPFNPHPEIGKYFKFWKGSKYIPNDYLQYRYPEDNSET